MKAASKKKKVEKNWLEWVVFGVSLVLVVGVVGYLAYEGAKAGDTPPQIEVRLGEPERSGEDFIVPVRVTNRGEQTAEGVQIEIELEGGDKTERGEFAVAFLPRRATREGWVTFKSDPRAGRLKPRVLGYEKP